MMLDSRRVKLALFDGRTSDRASRFSAVVIVVLLMVGALPMMPAEAAETSITLRDPVGGEELVAGSVTTIRWQVSSTGGYVAIYLSTDGGARWTGLDTILSTPDHSFGYYDWQIPPNLESDTCKIRVVWKSSLS
ncbi:MAG: hypothetical protein GWN74_11480, partial [Thermoplasmata archaeon]|nr:hypothetical protein [Thermoplasmata archaeon]